MQFEKIVNSIWKSIFRGTTPKEHGLCVFKFFQPLKIILQGILSVLFGRGTPKNRFSNWIDNFLALHLLWAFQWDIERKNRPTISYQLINFIFGIRSGTSLIQVGRRRTKCALALLRLLFMNYNLISIFSFLNRVLRMF